MGVQEALDQLERTTIIPMQFVVPVARFFFQQRLNLADGGLAQIDNVHGWVARSAAPAAQIYHSRFRQRLAAPARRMLSGGDTFPTQSGSLPRGRCTGYATMRLAAFVFEFE